jgi:hypothetical protein
MRHILIITALALMCFSCSKKNTSMANSTTFDYIIYDTNNVVTAQGSYNSQGMDVNNLTINGWQLAGDLTNVQSQKGSIAIGLLFNTSLGNTININKGSRQTSGFAMDNVVFTVDGVAYLVNNIIADNNANDSINVACVLNNANEISGSFNATLSATKKGRVEITNGFYDAVKKF